MFTAVRASMTFHDTTHPTPPFLYFLFSATQHEKVTVALTAMVLRGYLLDSRERPRRLTSICQFRPQDLTPRPFNPRGFFT